jgi:glycosyltransferase 2 family protein
VKTIWLRICQAGVTVGLLVWIFRDEELRAGILRALQEADPMWIAIGIGVAGLGEVGNVIRWGIFLRVQRIMASWWRITSLFMTGVFFNLFLFGTTGGDLVKVWYLAREHRTKKGAVFLTVVMDRLIGLVVLVVFAFLISVWRFDWLSQTPLAATLQWFLIAFASVSIVVMAGSFVISGTGLLHRLPERMPAREKFLRLASAYNLFAQAWRASIIALALSFPVLFTFFGVFYCAARAYGASATLLDVFTLMPVITVVTSLPISISGLGVREKLFQELLGDLAHVPADVAVLISLTGFSIYILWGFVGAAFYLATGASWKSARRLPATGALALQVRR